MTIKENGIFNKENVGLYSDDCLAIIRGSAGEREKISKKLIKLFEKESLKITIEREKVKTYTNPEGYQPIQDHGNQPIQIPM